MPDEARNAKLDLIVSTLREKFVASAGEKLERIDQEIKSLMSAVDANPGTVKIHAVEIRKLVHALKGTAGSFGFMSITRIAEAFEAFLAASESTGHLSAPDAHLYITSIRRIIVSGIEPSEDETTLLIGALPSPAQPDAG